MKKLFTLFVALVTTVALWAGNAITYKASSKLSETTAATYSSSGLHVNAFNVAISSHSFSNGTGTITFIGNVTSIGDYAFYDCGVLTSITIPNSVTTIGESAFSGCDGLTSVTIPNSVTTIGDYAFSCCDGLTSVTIPNSVTTIGDWAFSMCDGLTSVTIPNSVTSIGSSVFFLSNGLVSITVASGNTRYSSQDGVLFNYDKTYLIKYPAGNSRSTYSIPSTVITIEDYAFDDCSSLRSVSIPSSVTYIDSKAFNRCNSLTSITVASGNTKYSSQDGVLFNKAKTELIQYPIGNSRSSYTIPSTVITIGDYAFDDCSSLTSVTIPNSVKYIETGAFQYCTRLASVTMGTSVIEMDYWVFQHCTNLIAITIPKTVTYIGRKAFNRCNSLTSITVASGNTKYSSQDGVLFNKAKTELIQYPIGNSRSSYTIPSTVITIGDYAFDDCSSLTSVTIPNSVTTIGFEAFCECRGLISMTLKCTTPPTIADLAFSDLPSSCVFYIPCGTLSQYRSIWSYVYKLYEESPYSLVLQQSQYGTINNSSPISCSNNIAYLTATPDEHCHFVKWSDGNTTNPRTITITNDITLSATFAIDTYSISANGTNGTIEGSGTYNYGDYATLLAIPTSGYEFIRWSDGEEYNPHIIYVEKDISLTAIFEPIQSALGEITQDDIIAFTMANTLYVNDTKSPYTVYNSAGVIIYQGCATSINLPASGMYIVKQNAITTKVITQ